MVNVCPASREMEGVVISGNHLGRTIGFPTANMAIADPLLLIPCGGVYHSTVTVRGVTYEGMTNIGTRPTVGGSGALTVETHIFGFDEMIYGEQIMVGFLERIRDERRFPSLDALRTQLKADAAAILDED